MNFTNFLTKLKYMMEGLPNADELYNKSMERQKVIEDMLLKQFKELFIEETKKATELGIFQCQIKLEKTYAGYEILYKISEEVKKCGFETTFCPYEATFKIYWGKKKKIDLNQLMK